MKKILLLLLTVIFVKLGISQSLKDSSIYYIGILENDKAINYLKRKLKENKYKNDTLSKKIDKYNLACAYSLKNDNKKCLETLYELAKSPLGINVFDKDPDFYNVSHTKEWRILLLNYKNKNSINLLDTIYINLSQIAINDQAFYKAISFYKKKYGQKSSKEKVLWNIKDSLNKANLKLVLHYIDNGYNVLSDSIVGDFSQKCFLVVQHADFETMEKFLPIVKNLYDRKQTSGDNYALLYDRVSVNKNKGIQYYGSQINPETNQPYLIKDEKNVDKRRAALGMEPIFEYCSRFQIIYHPKRKK